MTTALSSVRYTADQIAEALGKHAPTPEQREVIEAGLEPMLVVAGAGSGKTATMADRVVYLVANGLVKPHEILGVTFTRKAAGELAERVTERLKSLVVKGLVSAEDLIPPQLLSMVYGDNDDGTREAYLGSLVEPTISTYHSYAHSLVSEYGLHIGLEPEAELIGGAQAWQLVTPLVEQYVDGEELAKAGANVNSLPAQVLKLSQDMAEHLRTPDEVVGWLDQEIGRTSHWQDKLAKDGQRQLNTLRLRREAAKIAAQYQQVKRDQGFMDHGDLLRHAARIAATVPAVSLLERQKYRIVLLDEFQDTSHAQMQLFDSLFGAGSGHAVTAVGDPNQSIYGFRGASAGQLFEFPQKFTRKDTQTGTPIPAELKQLTIAWRNGRRILAVANRLVEPFSRYTEVSGPAWHRGTGHLRKQLKELINADRMDPQGRALDQAGHPLHQPGAAKVSDEERIAAPTAVAEGSVAFGFYTTEEEETAAVVAEMENALTVEPGAQPPSCAVLATTHGQLGTIAESLRLAGVPYELAGLSGLLYRPEIVEVLSYLRVLADPKRSDALIRILGGARYRIGPKDLYQLGRVAESAARGRSKQTRQDSDDEDKLASLEPELEELQSLVEALEVFDAGLHQDGAGQQGFSPEGSRRLHRAREDFRALRELLHLDLGTLIQGVIRGIGLDTEVSARPWETGSRPTRQLEALIEYAESYAATSSSQDLQGFLDWLEAAQKQERGLEQAAADPKPGAVQLLTVHASKGLEWDVVAVVGLRKDRFPRAARMASNWLKREGDLPWPLRGDAGSLPQWASDLGSDQSPQDLQRTARVWQRSAGVTKSLAQYEGPVYSEDCAVFSEEEDRRLAYVAMTRARTRLLCTGACFYGATGGSEASPFLQEIRHLAHAVDSELRAEELAWHVYDDAEKNPNDGLILSASWPYDPLEELTVQRQILQPADLSDDASVDTYLEADSAPGSREATAEKISRRHALAAAAQRVKDHMAVAQRSEDDQASPWWQEAQFVIRRAQRRRSSADEPEVPNHLAASSIVRLAHQRAEVLEQARRPIPQKPSSQARRGTAIHSIIEEVLEVQGSLPGIDELFDLYAGQDVHGELDLQTVRESYQGSRWATWPAFAVEVPLETTIAGITLRGRIDAVFAKNARGEAVGNSSFEEWMTLPRQQRNAEMAGCSFELVDWKTGDVPAGPQLQQKELQLAVYRIGFSRLYGVPLENIKCYFFYLDHQHVHEPETLDDAATLTARIANGEAAG